MTDGNGYAILVMEILDGKWSTYFSPFLLDSGEKGTLLAGQVHDQAELFGILLKIRDLGLHLISVNPLQSQ